MALGDHAAELLGNPEFSDNEEEIRVLGDDVHIGELAARGVLDGKVLRDVQGRTSPLRTIFPRPENRATFKQNENSASASCRDSRFLSFYGVYPPKSGVFNRA